MLSTKVMQGRWLAAATALALTACVVGAERRATMEQSRSVPPRPDERNSAGDLLAGGPPEPGRQVRPPKPDLDSVWVEGSWRWDGVRYVWQPGRWEPKRPSWVRGRR